MQRINEIIKGRTSQPVILFHHTAEQDQGTNPVDQAEIIRRLRIQNKKLMEQVLKLRLKLSVNKADKTRLMAKLQDQQKLNKHLSKALRS